MVLIAVRAAWIAGLVCALIWSSLTMAGVI